MEKIQIKHRFTGAVLFEFEPMEGQESGMVDRHALEAAVKNNADLSFADLRSADLSSANLRSADLSFADLSSANLRSADLIDGVKLISGRPLLMIGPIGSRADMLQIYLTDAGMYIRAGCFLGTREEFVDALASEHGENNHGTEYAAALVLADAHAKIWTPE